MKSKGRTSRPGPGGRTLLGDLTSVCLLTGREGFVHSYELITQIEGQSSSTLLLWEVDGFFMGASGDLDPTHHTTPHLVFQQRFCPWSSPV